MVSTDKLREWSEIEVILQVRELDELVKIALENAQSASGANWVSIIRFEESIPKEFFPKDNPYHFSIDVIRDTGYSAHIMRTGEIIRVKNLQSDPEAREGVNPKTLNTNADTLLGFPLENMDSRLGVIWFHFDEPQKITDEEVEEINKQVSTIMARYEKEYRSAQLESAFGSILAASKAMIQTSDLNVVLQTICSHIYEFIIAKNNSLNQLVCVNVFILEDEKDMLRFLTAFPPEWAETVRETENDFIHLYDTISLVGRAITEKMMIFEPDCTGVEGRLDIPKGYQTHLSIPLYDGDEIIGALLVEAYPKKALAKQDLPSFELFANLIASAIAQHQNKANQEEFLADVIHQLTGPISSLQKFTTYLQRVYLVRNLQEEIYHKQYHLTSRVLRYIDNIQLSLGSTRELYDSDRFKRKAKLVDDDYIIGVLVRWAIAFQSEKFTKNITGPNVDKDSFYEFPKIRIEERLFEILILNLYDNAIKYSYPNQKVHVRGHVDRAKSMVEIYIENHGVGIPENKLKWIFQRNTRTVDAKNHAAVGTGIGLYICRRIAKLHNGDLSVKSEFVNAKKQLNKVTFILSIPYS